ncbi:MAG TPA: hypothetical protein PK733_08410 [Clostridiales bacterium]|nr:hypothetical protein [Clostridiales bacterium]
MNKIITIWGNPEFGCELAYRIAKETGKNILLLDVDLLSPKADLYLNIKKESDDLLERKTGLDILIEWSNRKYLNGELIRKAAIQREELKNLYIITGNYDLDNFEYYTIENLGDIIEKANQNFEITILLANKHIYDAYTITSLLRSDINIAAIEPNTVELREYNNYLMFLEDKQGMRLDKTKFVGYEYIAGIHETNAELKEITEDTYIGKVRYSKARVLSRSKNKCYAKTMEKAVKRDYIKIIEQLELTPKLKTKENFKFKKID